MATERVFVDGEDAASAVLLVVFDQARTTKEDFIFGPITAEQIITDGLFISGNIDKLVNRLADIPGALVESSMRF